MKYEEGIQEILKELELKQKGLSHDLTMFLINNDTTEKEEKEAIIKYLEENKNLFEEYIRKIEKLQIEN